MAIFKFFRRFLCLLKACERSHKGDWWTGGSLGTPWHTRIYVSTPSQHGYRRCSQSKSVKVNGLEDPENFLCLETPGFLSPRFNFQISCCRLIRGLESDKFNSFKEDETRVFGKTCRGKNCHLVLLTISHSKGDSDTYSFSLSAHNWYHSWLSSTPYPHFTLVHSLISLIDCLIHSFTSFNISQSLVDLQISWTNNKNLRTEAQMVAVLNFTQ